MAERLSSVEDPLPEHGADRTNATVGGRPLDEGGDKVEIVLNGRGIRRVGHDEVVSVVRGFVAVSLIARSAERSGERRTIGEKSGRGRAG